jgi:4-amino-4-deoxy-L-arabinose transferase-like glycosyltransferase
VAIVALAAWLRLAHLGQIPACLEYDEAANVILAGEIAQGKAFPVFIRPYTGKEVLYFYLAAGMMQLAGVTPFALRLTSAFLGLLNVVLTWWFVRQLFAVTGVEEGQRRWLARFGAALVAVSYWQVNLSRFGYRAIALPPLLALAVGFWLRGLREGGQVHPGSFKLSAKWFALSGALSGLSSYT